MRRWLPVIIWALDAPLPRMGQPVLGPAPRVRRCHGERVPAQAANMWHRAHLLLPSRAVFNVSVIYLEQKNKRVSIMRKNCSSRTF